MRRETRSTLRPRAVPLVAVAALLALVVSALPLTTASAGERQLPLGPQTAAQQRAVPAPKLTRIAKRPARRAVPRTRYEMAGGCYALQAPNGRWLVRSGSTYVARARHPKAAAPVRFQATKLGSYLLQDARRGFLSRGSAVSATKGPSTSAEWVVTKQGRGFRIGTARAGLRVLPGGRVSVGEPSVLRLRLVGGCAHWPEVQVSVRGRPHKGVSPLQEVRGYVDDHLHWMAFPFLGGGIHCGRPWHKYGVTYALRDCADHIATGGKLALPEIILSGRPTHDPQGWPTFRDWPHHDSLTHESTYYKWVERSWRGGQRLMVNLLVENEVLCTVYPNLSSPLATVTRKCNDMDQVIKQAKLNRQLQNYVDAQWGGPGKGWFRIVTTPAQARRVINQGKLAVVLGTETSDIFNCSKANAVDELLGQLGLGGANPLSCTRRDIDRGLDRLHKLGVRQMVLTHKFDNAFGGTKGDEGFNGVATNAGNFLMTGSFLGMGACAPGQAHDNAQLNLDELPAKELAQLGQIFGPLAALNLFAALPLYPPGPQCNRRGLTDLGAYTVKQMAKRHMIVDVDHWSSKARDEALDILERLRYSGVISSHSWADHNALPRVYRLGGFVGPYGGSSTSLAESWKALRSQMDGRYYWGVGFGIDMNGLGAQGGPRGVDAKNPVTYPFRGLGGVKVFRQRSGKRVYDINRDGVDHYGLLPDWIEDASHVAGTRAIVDDLARGAEAYLQMWERATGIANDACRQPGLRRQVGSFRRLAKGTPATAVLRRLGQPHLRRGNTYRYCALQGRKNVSVTVRFAGAKVRGVRVVR